MAKYLVDGKMMTGVQVLAFAKKRHKINNKGGYSPKTVGQARRFLEKSGKYGAGGKAYSVMDA